MYKRQSQYADLSEFYLKYDVLDKVLNENMSIDEILSGMDSKGKPARIAMPLSSLKAVSYTHLEGRFWVLTEAEFRSPSRSRRRGRCPG